MLILKMNRELLKYWFSFGQFFPTKLYEAIYVTVFIPGIIIKKTILAELFKGFIIFPRA